MVTKDGNVSYKVFDLSDIDSVENGAWKRYRYSLKSKSEIGDLTIKFLAKSGDRDVSIIAWDNVKLEYTEPGAEGNNGDDQANNRTIQETQAVNSTKIHEEEEETESTLNQSGKESPGETKAPKEIGKKAQTEQSVDVQAEKRNLHEESLEANSTNIPEEATETENTFDQSINETTESGQTATPKESKTNETNLKESKSQNTTITKEEKANIANNMNTSVNPHNNLNQTTTSIFQMLTNSDENMSGAQTKKDKNITIDDLHLTHEIIDELITSRETTIPVTAKHIDDIERNNTEPSNKEDRSFKQKNLTETSHIKNKTSNYIAEGNVHETTIEHIIEDNPMQEEKFNKSVMIETKYLNATTARSNTMDATESNIDTQTAQHIDTFYSNTTKLGENENIKNINASVAHSTDVQQSPNVEERVTTKNVLNKSSYTKKVEVRNKTMIDLNTVNDNPDTTMKYLMETSIPKPSQGNPEKSGALGLGWNTSFPSNQSIIFRVFTHVFNIGNSSNFSININIP